MNYFCMPMQDNTFTTSGSREPNFQMGEECVQFNYGIWCHNGFNLMKWRCLNPVCVSNKQVLVSVKQFNTAWYRLIKEKILSSGIWQII